MYKSFILLLLCSYVAFCQSIVVSEYFTAQANPSLEWTELLVISDNLNIVGYSIRDNSAVSNTPNSWQGGVRFKNHGLWKNLRAGTIIVINHRGTNAYDADKTDGYIEIGAENNEYFEPRCWGCTIGFDWIIKALNIAQDCDIIQIINSSDNHVHSLSHLTDLQHLGDYNNLPNNKISRMGSTRINASLRVVPGRNLLSYNTGITNNETFESISNITKGFPNNSDNSIDVNQLFWRELRQPTWNNPTLKATIVNNKTVLEWNKINDPFPNDSTQGYLIIRCQEKYLSSITNPIDGVIYKQNDNIGYSTVAKIINTSQITTYTDDFVLPCGEKYIYRIFAFRFYKDNLGNDIRPTMGRGRSYNELNYANVEIVRKTPDTPKIICDKIKSDICEGDSLYIYTNKKEVLYEWYYGDDTYPFTKTNNNGIFIKRKGKYYVKAFNEHGCSSQSAIFTLNVIPYPKANIYVINYDNCIYHDTTIYICSKDSIRLLPEKNTKHCWYNGNTAIFDNYLVNHDLILTLNNEGEYYNICNNSNMCFDTSVKINIKFYSIVLSLETDTISLILDDNNTMKDTTIKIINKSNVDFILNDTSIILPENIEILKPILPFVVNANDSIEVTIRYQNKEYGKKNDSIVFNLPCKNNLKLYFNSYKEKVNYTIKPSFIDFGYKNYCDTITSDTIINIANNGDKAIIINNPKFENGIYAINYPELPFTLNSKENKDISIKYKINKDIILSDTLIFPIEYNNKKIEMKIELKGQFKKIDYNIENDTLNYNFSDCEFSKNDTIILTNMSKEKIEIFTDTINNTISLINTERLIIKPDSTISLIYSIMPEKYGLNKYFINFYSKPCLIKKYITVYIEKIGYLFDIADSIIDFGDIYKCTYNKENSKEFTIKVEGYSKEIPKVIDYYFTQKIKKFSTTLQIGQELNIGNNEFSISCNNFEYGNITDTLIIVFSPCNEEKYIIVKANIKNIDFEVDNSEINLGEIQLSNDKKFSVKLMNNMDNRIKINSIEGVNKPIYSSSDLSFPFFIKEKEQLKLSFNYSQELIKKDTLYIKINISEPCDTTIYIKITANTVFNNNIIVSGFNKSNCRINEEIELPLFFYSHKSIDSIISIGDEININILYDKDLLMYKNLSIGELQSDYITINSIDESKNGLLNIKVIIKDNKIKSKELIKIRFKTLLGNDSIAYLTIDTIIINNKNNLLFDKLDGEICIYDDCYFKNRLIEISQQYLNIYNKSNTILIEYNLISNDKSTLKIYNSIGIEIKEIAIKNNNISNNKIELNTQELQIGCYFICLSNGLNRIIKNFYIVK